jgi:hypothetical protein
LINYNLGKSYMIKKLLLSLFCLFGSLGYCQQASYQVGLTGTLTNPDGSLVNGFMTLQLTKSTVKNTCVTPNQTVPNTQIRYNIVNGVIVNGSTALFTSTDCLSPRVPYYVQEFASNGKLQFADNWYLPQQALSGSSRLINVGTLVDEYFGGPITVAIPQGIISNPTVSQMITQPVGTSFIVNTLVVSGTCTGCSSGGVGFTLTTLGTSGAASLIGTILNIPQYSGGSGMTWPSGGAGIPKYNGSSAWGSSYNASNLLPANFLPAALANSTSVNGTSIPASVTLVQKIANGTLSLATSSIGSYACQTITAGSVNSATATGAAATDSIKWTPNASLSGVTGYAPSSSGGLSISAYPTSGYVNFDVCNWTASGITPGAVTLNWEVTR